ncbi:hypothetical protein HN51_011526 [Arachis hypogaea]|uniref:WD repeat-containing protein n=1 Tax=Arachis hypogaea TaxID=3818 RepID=A0A445DYU0_ARAHY|nr:WD repeat-containing protein 44 [Arachis hypogaea]QHO56836.1 WD repeat-containing protein [Arachis hypogaea]RYR68317.1 hypothetical protein Ahy_A03g014817 [Arachis hypogaea]
MTKPIVDQEQEEEETHTLFYDSHDRLLSCSTSSSNSDDDTATSPQNDTNTAKNDSTNNSNSSSPTHALAMCRYDIWISEPSSVSERRSRLLRHFGLPARSVSSQHLHRAAADTTSAASAAAAILRSKSESAADRCDLQVPAQQPAIRSVCRSGDAGSVVNNGNCSANGNVSTVIDSRGKSDETRREIESVEEEACTIRDLDNGKEFVVKEVRKDGTWKKLREVGTGRHLTMEEFEMTVGHSPIVQELMRRQNVEDGNGDGDEDGDGDGDAVDLNSNDCSRSGGGGDSGGESKVKRRGSWFKSIKSVASSVAAAGHKERWSRSGDERDTSSEKGGRRSSSATDDSQDGSSFLCPERVRVRQYGKSCKELTGLYKSQEIQAHEGSIWSIRFSLDGRYLASAGEDCVIHVWQVVETERKGELLLMEKPEDANVNMLFVMNGSPERATLSPSKESSLEKRRRGRPSVSRKSLSLDQLVVPETVFALTEKPICSFEGHLDDVLDLSWSRSQHLLSSSMDKTVRLWQLSSKSCLKIFSHSDYVTCIQFNPVDDRYFISGSLDAKVRIWSIPDRQVVDWTDLHEMVTAASYTPDGQGALVGSIKGSCHLYNTSENKLQQKSQINLQNRRKRSRKITGFQFAPGSSSEVLITSSDSRIRVVDGIDLVHKFKGFRNSTSQISASLTANGKYIVAASEDSHIYIWRNEADCRPNRSKAVTVTSSYEHFHCKDVSVAIPWPGMDYAWEMHDTFSKEQPEFDDNVDEVSSANHPPTPVEEDIGTEGSQSASGCNNSPLHGTIAGATDSYFFDRISATWPDEKQLAATRNRSSQISVDLSSNAVSQNMSAWGMVIVTAGLRGEIRTFQNFGLPLGV